MSYDFKLMFVFHGAMMLLFLTGSMLSVVTEVFFAAILLAACTILGVRHRRTTPWRWPGAPMSRVLGAGVTVLLGGVFLYSASPLFPPTKPEILPWYLAGFGIVVFATLNALAVVELAEADYFSPRASPQVVERPWRKAVRVAYFALFLAAWLVGVASFYYFGITFRDGAETPTAEQTEPIRDHGKVVYVAPSQKRVIALLQTGMAFGIPIAMGLGAVLHFIVGIRLFPNTPTLSEWRRRRDQGRG